MTTRRAFLVILEGEDDLMEAITPKLLKDSIEEPFCSTDGIADTVIVMPSDGAGRMNQSSPTKEENKI